MFARAGNRIAAAAIVADAAARDVVDDHAVALVEPPEPLALFDDHAARLVSGDGSGNIRLRALADVLAVNAADIASADGRGLRLDEHLSVARRRNFKLAEFDRAVARKDCARHLCHDRTLLFSHLVISIISRLRARFHIPDRRLPAMDVAILKVLTSEARAVILNTGGGKTYVYSISRPEHLLLD